MGPPSGGDVEIAARPASGYAGPWTGAGTPRGQPGAAHRLPPPLPTDFLAFPTFPPLAACGRDRRRNFDFFQPLSGAFRPCALRLPHSVARQKQEGEPAKPGEPPEGVPRERSENSPKTDQKRCIEES